jgi:DNA polymerase elongation subunit (family B)
MSEILTLDIETSPHEAYSFNVWKTNLQPFHIIQPAGMMTYALKFKGKREVIYRTWNDDDFLSTLHENMNKADLIVGYNHEKFDLRHINREFVEKGFFPTRPTPTVDMLSIVKKRFNFPHNRLDYIASRVLGETKLETGGFALWPEFMNGDPRALKVMKKYNIHDTRLTERLYDKLLPWVPNHPYLGGTDIDMRDEDVTYECPCCGNSATIPERPRRTRCYAIRVVHCPRCGTYFDGKRRKIA